MKNITRIPLQELQSDLADGQVDVVICQKALAAGVKTYSGGEVLRRLSQNEEINEMIMVELVRRKEAEYGGSSHERSADVPGSSGEREKSE